MAKRLHLLLPFAALAALVFPLTAAADHGNADDASPNMLHVANLPPPPQFLNCDRGSTSCFNSDLAFYDSGSLRGPYDLAAQGNYEGFRLINIRDPENPVEISVMECRSNQGDLSFHQADDRLLLIQSVEEPTTTDECSTAIETGVAPGTHPITGLPGVFRVPGFEGLRIFDVTNPEAPVFIKGVPTACGSHTHTTIRDERNQRAIVYVSSYPTGARLTPREALGFGGPTCVPPHQKISIVEIPDKNPAAAHVLREQPLDADTLPFRGTIGSGGTGAVGCHDITAFYDTQSANPGQNFQRNPKFHVAGGACLSEGQLWDITDPANPTTLTTHTHIRNPFIDRPTAPIVGGLFHTASFSWDGDLVLFTDEWQGGAGHGCDGPQDHRGNVWFYKTVPPGTPQAPLVGRYILPRDQPDNEICTMHNGNVITVSDESDGQFGVSSAYEGGTTVFDFTGAENRPVIQQPLTGTENVPLVAREVAFFDAKLDGGPTGAGPMALDNVWSSYWYNDFVYASSGLPGATCSVVCTPPNPRPGNRGFDVYMLVGKHGRLVDRSTGTPTVTTPQQARTAKQFTGRDVRYMNPQTQDTFQALSHGR